MFKKKLMFLIGWAVLMFWVTSAFAAGGDIFGSNFNEEGIGNWQPHGEGIELDITKDTVSGKKVLKVTFDDASPVAWCQKGVKISFKKNISWDDFNYIYCNYKMNPGPSGFGYLIRDEAGNWWHSFQARDMVTARWGFYGAKKTSFQFSYNDNPSIKEGEKKSKILWLGIYFSTPSVNKGIAYNLLLDNITLSLNLPEESIEKKEAAIAETSQKTSEFPLQWKVTSFNKNGNLIVDGKPFFPLGLYSCIGIDEASGTFVISHYTGETTREKNISRFKAVKDAGFNLLQTYTMNLYGQKVNGPGWLGDERQRFPEEDGETTHELYREGIIKFMDYAQEVGLKAMIGAYSSYSILKPLPLLGREKRWEKNKKVLEDNIKALKNHPALLAWYLIDEPGSVNMPAEDITDCYQYIKTLDVVHPMYIAATDPRGDLQYFKAIDIIGPDSYPLAFDKPLIQDAERLDEFAKHQAGNPPMPQLWQIVQICQWIEGKRLPSIAEMRLMSLLALTRDVKGLMFYEHQNYPERNPGQWANISKVVNSLHTVIPDLLADSDLVKNYTVSDTRINSIMRKIKDAKTGKSYYSIIAVNPTQDKSLSPVGIGLVTFTFDNLELPNDSIVTVLDEEGEGKLSLGNTRELKLSKNGGKYSFVDNFGEYASHIYRIGVSPKI